MGEVVDIRGPVGALQDDPKLWRALWRSKKPEAEHFRHWLITGPIMAADLLGLRGGPVEYVWPGTRAEFDAMISAAIEAVRPRARRRRGGGKLR